MQMYLIVRSVIVATIFVVALNIMLTASAGQDSAEYEYSEAQKLLFANQHLQNIRPGATLYYDFSQSGSVTNKIDDQITLEITAISADDGRDVQTVFLSGENNRPYNEVKGFRSNPLIMFFLQWDVEKMEDVSGISRHYMRHAIRNAFLSKAQSELVTLPYGKGNIKGKRITLEPLKTDENNRKYPQFMNKQYEFAIAESVPGGIYSIKTKIPGSVSGDKVSEYTEIIFNRIEPKTAFSNKT